MATVQSLAPDQLYKRTDPDQFPFETTAQMELPPEIVGQERAVAAVEFGIGIRREGYNIYALGAPGTGKHSVVRRFLERQAREEPTPSDWCYVYNFKVPHQPRALELPAGTGVALRRDMETLVSELRSAIPAAFETDEYRVRRQAIEQRFAQQQEQAFDALQEKARAQGLALLRTPAGLVFAPLRPDGTVMHMEQFQQLPAEEQERLRKKVEAMQEELQKVLLQIPRWERQLRKELRELNQEIAQYAMRPLFEEMREKYGAFPKVLDYLDAVYADVLENLPEFLQPEEPRKPTTAPLLPGEGQRFSKYAVNVLVDNSQQQGAPVVFEDNPSLQNLVGRIEYMAIMGGMVTDFSLIKPGALHRANGGYLMLDILKVLAQPFAWEGLKRALRSKQLRIETPGQMFGQVNVVTLEPEPIPLNVKIALVGDRTLYYLLSGLDPDFDDLFKVMADFNDDIRRTPESHLAYARLIGGIVRDKELLPFHRAAVARVVDEGARLAADGHRLSMQVAHITDILQEADYWARREGASVVQREHVEQALEAQRYRAWRVPERVQEVILDDIVHIQTEGAVVGQINGLSVTQLGPMAFGRPNRITARVRMGRGEVVDIEREVALGGPIHSKGVLILSSYLGARYATDFPLSLQASLVFEQSYSGVEGDSASSAELYALLSALADLPIRQSLAVTGSVDQFGNVQAIGGVNEKIEGFFDICKARGLTGEQGVLIPEANVRHLMLRQEVVDAVAQGQFHIYPIRHVDQGIELLTGVPAGQPDDRGDFPEGTVNRRVQDRLREFAQRRAEYARAGQEDGGEGDGNGDPTRAHT